MDSLIRWLLGTIWLSVGIIFLLAAPMSLIDGVNADLGNLFKVVFFFTDVAVALFAFHSFGSVMKGPHDRKEIE